jgi:hypothetical protein
MADSKSNLNAVKEEVYEHIARIGKTEGQGAVARVTLAEYIVEQGKAKLLEADDASECWARMSAASLAEQDSIGGSEQTFRQRVSDIRHFIVLGNNPHIDGVAALAAFKERMVAIRKGRKGPKGRVWPMMLRFAMNQSTLTKTMPTKAMDKLCDLPVKPRRQYVDKLWGIRELLNAANEGVENKGVQQAISLLDETVTALGGTKRQKLALKRAEKAAKKAAKRSSKKATKKAAKKAAKSAKNGNTESVH